MRFRTIVLGALVLVGSFIGATLLMNVLWPAAPAPQANKPTLVAMPPLQPLTGTSVVLAPAAIALTAIRDALDAQAPRNLSGKPQNTVSKLLSDAQLTFTVNRGPLAATARQQIAAAVGGLAAQAPELSAKVAVNDLHLAGIAYDADTLRIIANASGSVNVAISSLSMQ
jgi:hypothetical protein